MNLVKWTSIIAQAKLKGLALRISTLSALLLFCPSLKSVTWSVQTATGSEPTIGANMSVKDLGEMVVTSYQPIPSQTDASPTWTSIGDRTTKFGAAVSRDLLASGVVKYGDVLKIEGYGLRVVNDTMNKRHKKSVDLLVFTYAEEKQIGTRRLRVWRIRDGDDKRKKAEARYRSVQTAKREGPRP